jgi:hypothetical protein
MKVERCGGDANAPVVEKGLFTMETSAAVSRHHVVATARSRCVNQTPGTEHPGQDYSESGME